MNIDRKPARSQYEANVNSDIKKTYTLYWFAVFGAILLTAGIWLLDPLLDKFPHLPDSGPRWYYWKLPNPDTWARITAWGGYAAHQLIVWILIIRRVKGRNAHKPRLRQNYLMLGTNLGFILFHLVQTHIWYDGLAQDVPIWTSQYSVIIMLVIVLLMLFPLRGVFWGRKIKLKKDIREFLKKTHSFYISWALIYTFWFHPMEGDGAILLGFFYMFLLMIQLSMHGTKIHYDLRWIGFLEFYVGLHGVAVALMNGQEVWTMFLFGFLFISVFTHMHGLKLMNWAKFLVVAAFSGGLIAAYSYRGWEKIYEVIFIPSALYGGAFALWLVAGIGLFVTRRIGKSGRQIGKTM